MNNISNQIANFGVQAGQNIQRTVGNALARNENKLRYQNQQQHQNKMLDLRQQQADTEQARYDAGVASAAEKEEAAFGGNWATTYFNATPEQRPQILQAGAANAVQKGYMTAAEAQGLNEGKMLQLASASGVNVAPDKPKMASQSNIGKLLAERNSLSPGDPNIAVYDAQIDKLSGPSALDQLAIISARQSIQNNKNRAADRVTENLRKQENHDLKVQTEERKAAKEKAEIKDAERIAKKGRTQAKSLVSLVDELIRNKDGLESYSGLSGGLPTVLPSQKSFEAKLDRLQNSLTLDKTDTMTGVLSESDILLLARSAQALAEGGDYKSNREELTRIRSALMSGIDGTSTQGQVEPEASKTIGGVNYIKINGQWFQE